MSAVRTTSRLGTIKSLTPRPLLNMADVSTRAFGLGTVANRPGPDFLIIGTKRGGTTSLFNYLMQHPGILGTFPRIRSRKSTNFFFADHPASPYWHRSHFHTEGYRRLLETRLGYRPLGFEASPYYIWDPRVAPIAAKLYPELKAIVLLRDPVRRAWSHYQERVQNGVEPLSFTQALQVEDQRLSNEVDRMMANATYHSTAHDWYSYRTRGEYLAQIVNWRRHFPPEQLLILRSESLYTNTQAVMDDTCAFLDIPSYELPHTTVFNATWRTREEMPPSDMSVLSRHFSSHKKLLEEYLKMEFQWS